MREPGARSDTAIAEDAPLAVDSAPPVLPASPSLSKAPKLSPLADTIAERLVFAPKTQTWFLGAVREKALGVDLGRIDIDLKKQPARLEAFQQAVAALSPVKIGTRLRVRASWGEEDMQVRSIEAVAGRVVARLDHSAYADSQITAAKAVIVSATRSEVPDSSRLSACVRELDAPVRARATFLADSLETALRSSDLPIYERLAKSVKTKKSIVVGCFGDWKAVVIASIFAGDYEWWRERVVLVGSGKSKVVPMRDLRLRVHEGVLALDADGDGVDELGARAWTTRGGGSVILKVVGDARLERFVAGFSYER